MLKCEELTCYRKNPFMFPGECICETAMFVCEQDYNEHCKNCTGTKQKGEIKC